MKMKTSLIVVAAMAVVGSAGAVDLTATYTSAATSLVTGLTAMFESVVPAIIGLLIVLWAPRVIKRLIKTFTS